MKSTILKQFGSGQITIPKKWRGDAKERFWRARQRGDEIILSPIEDEEIIFDAERDNDGKLVPVKDFLKTLNSVIQDG